MSDKPPASDAGQTDGTSPDSSKKLRDSKGWDGKLRVQRTDAADNNTEDAPSESDGEAEEVPGEEIAADEGKIHGP